MVSKLEQLRGEIAVLRWWYGLMPEGIVKLAAARALTEMEIDYAIALSTELS